MASFFFFLLFSRFCFFRSPFFVSSVIAQRKPVFAPPESAEFSILGGLSAAGQPRGRPRQRCTAGQRRGSGGAYRVETLMAWLKVPSSEST